jgi:hypothetical protein
MVLSFIGIVWLVFRLGGNWLKVLARRFHATKAEMIGAVLISPLPRVPTM